MKTNVVKLDDYRYMDVDGQVQEYWGFHLMLNARNCNRASITSKENVENFARELVQRIDMKAYGNPMVVNFGTGNKAGFTLVQLIETSNICAHFCNDTGDVYLDVFSCKPFNNADVKRCFREFFSPQHIAVKRVNRRA
jgi:S-adenosylmethionine decarboxylase